MKTTKAKATTAVAVLLAIGMWCGVVMQASAAPPGDSPGKATHGFTCVLMDDGGSNIATAIWDAGSRLAGSNSISIHNPSASSGTIYCGWKNNVTSTTGYPVAAGTSLSVDVKCTNGASCPMLYCTTGSATVNQTSPNCTRWMQVQ